MVDIGDITDAATGPLPDVLSGSPANIQHVESLGTFSSTAYGPPWNAINGTGVTAGGTDLRGDKGKGKYIVAVDPAVIKLGTKLKIKPNPFGDENIVFLADDTGGAIQGKRIDFFDWRGRTFQMRWGTRNVEVAKTDQASTGDILSTAGNAAGGAISGAFGVVDFIADLVGTVLDFRKLGELLANAFVWWIRVVGKAFWKYALAPVVHWNERAVHFYWDTFFGSGKVANKGRDNVYFRNAGPVTLIFWAFGYAILWHKPDMKRADAPRETMLGRAVRSTEGTAARRHLTRPKDVDKKTKPKPEPKRSSTPIVKTRELAATRRRAVKVTATRREGDSNGRERNPESKPEPTTSTLETSEPR